MTCKGCDEYYIGETGTYLSLRMNIHRCGVRNENSLKVDEHIFRCASHLPPGKKYEVTPFYKVKENDTNFRRSIETSFIDQMDPLLNQSK